MLRVVSDGEISAGGELGFAPIYTNNPTTTGAGISFDWDPTTSAQTLLDKHALAAATNTFSKHLSTDGVTTGGAKAIAVTFKLQLPKDALAQEFLCFQWGSGESGTLRLRYFPLVDDPKHQHHLLEASVTGSQAVCTVKVLRTNALVPVYLEYDGLELILVCDDNADSYTSTAAIPLATGPTQMFFGSDVNDVYFDDLDIFAGDILQLESSTPTSFPYFVWDSADAGVIGIYPCNHSDGYYTFLDTGLPHKDVFTTFNLGVNPTALIASPILYVSEHEVALPYTGTVQGFLEWLDGRTLEFAWDGHEEGIKCSVSSGNVSLISTSSRGDGLKSYSARFTGSTGGDWGLTKAIIGKIPPQFYLPHTGELNRGISILGSNRRFDYPETIELTRSDENIITCSTVIGSVNNRPASKPSNIVLNPINFFGSSKAPFPKRSAVIGEPGALAISKKPSSMLGYGVYWETYVTSSIEPSKVTWAPKALPKLGDAFLAFSVDIPVNAQLRGINVNFSAAPPRLIGNHPSLLVHSEIALGNSPGLDTKFVFAVRDSFESHAYEWGTGRTFFDMALQGTGGDYTLIYTPMIAFDSNATVWKTIPSIGVDSVRVSNPNTWKELVFTDTDLELLTDEDGYSLLEGGRRVHFKFIVSAIPSAVVYSGFVKVPTTSSKK